MSHLALGIDVAKLKFNVCLLRKDGKLRPEVFANTAAGFSQFTVWLAANNAPQVHACLEATGTYGEVLATYLADSGHRDSVVNPAAIKAYAGCQLSRTKTDKVDAALIARPCLTQQPPLRTPPAPEIRTLQALVRCLSSLIEMRPIEVNRLSAGVDVLAVEVSIQSLIKSLRKRSRARKAEQRAHQFASDAPGRSRPVALYSRHWYSDDSALTC